MKLNFCLARFGVGNIFHPFYGALVGLFFFLGAWSSFAQMTVSGVVSDPDGVPLVGANVTEQGTSNGSMTNFDGEFTITVDGESAILEISFIGYASKTIPIEGRSRINIVLDVDVNTLNEVTVVGYGTQRRADLTGAIASVKAPEIEDFALARVDQAIQGRTPGVFILNSDSSPGGNTLIRIRGSNSVNGGNEPLVVVDGLQGADIDDINPSDIRSVEILKDASATAIYGSRGANGVVLITTKLGRIGKPVIEVSNTVSFQQVIKKLPIMSAGEFARLQNLRRSVQTFDGNVPIPIFSNEQISAFENGPSTDMQDVVYGTGFIHNTQLTVSGGTEKTRYLVSANHLTQDGIIENSGFNRTSLRINLASDINDFVKFGLNYSYIRSNATSPSFQGEVEFDDQVVNTAVRWSPTEPVFNPDGTYAIHNPDYGARDAWNPLASAREPINDNPSYNSNAFLFVDFEILEGLNLRIAGGATFGNALQKRFLNSNTKTGLSAQGQARVAEFGTEFYQNSNTLTFQRNWNKHDFKVTGLWEQTWRDNTGSEILANQFTVQELGFNNLEGAAIQTVSSEASERTLLSYMGRVNYGFDNKYLLVGTFRADASSVFGADNKWGYFPSASVGWRISEENFVKNLTEDLDLKFRYSWGETGNQAIGPYNSLARLSSSAQYPFNSDGQTITGFGLANIANPNLKWETTRQTNFGVDLSVFNNRLSITFDTYKKTTEDLLLFRNLPGFFGVPTLLDNVGSVENKGIELVISGDVLKAKDFNWYSSFNITSNKNTVLDLGEDERLTYQTTRGGFGIDEDFMVLEPGQPFGTMRGYVYEGVWGTDEEAEARAFGRLPGMSKYKDLDGDGDVDIDDKDVIGNAFPDYTFGWNNDISYKGWNLSFLFIGSKGADLFNQARIRREDSDEANSPRALNYWTSENQNTDVPGYLDGAFVESQNLENKYFIEGTESSRWVEDASFIRLRNVQLSYSFQKSNQQWMENLGINSLSLFASGTNLFTITDYTGYDPEVAAFADDDQTLGVDFSVYPAQKTYTFGVKASF